MHENLYNDISIAILNDVPIVSNIVHTQKAAMEFVFSFSFSHTVITCRKIAFTVILKHGYMMILVLLFVRFQFFSVERESVSFATLYYTLANAIQSPPVNV